MADGKMEVGRVEHYAVYLALVISMITTFLLGMLLTESLFGEGLSYFDRLSRMNLRVNRAGAQSIARESIDITKSSLEIHTLSSVVNRLPDEGVIWNSDFLKANKIEVGTPYSVTYTYDPSIAVDLDERPEIAIYKFDGPVTIKAGNLELSTNGFKITVVNDGEEYEGIIDAYRVDIDPFTYGDYSMLVIPAVVIGQSNILSSTALPSNVNVNRFDITSFSGIRGDNKFYVGDDEYSVEGDWWGFGGTVGKHSSKPYQMELK